MNKFENDGQAWDLLEMNGYKHDNGHINHPDNKIPTESEDDAIEYLFQEWDWCYTGR